MKCKLYLNKIPCSPTFRYKGRYYYGGWWWLGYDGWWWTDGYYWTLYGWDYYTTVSNVAAGTPDAARGTLPLITLGALALIGTAGILIRRNRRHDPEG